jgi:aspartate/tyrosine/aromatic aminotransferase
MFFEKVPEGLPDKVFGLQGAYYSDVRKQKMDLLVGTYKNSDLKGELLPSVKMAKEKILHLDVLADYLPIDGLGVFCQLIGNLCFGKKTWHEHQERIFVAQAIGGTGALQVGGGFLAQEVGRNIWITQPSWSNHRPIFERAGMKVENLHYYNSTLHSFDREAFFQGLNTIPEKGVVLFHAACHNPTGSDPTIDDWERISDICKKRSIFPFFDYAYQGFGDGIEEDSNILRLFIERGHEMLVAYSCSKNFGLYCQRVGAIFAIADSKALKIKVGSQIKKIIRALYSNPPAHGAMLVAEILKDPILSSQWVKDVNVMRQRIYHMREELVVKLRANSGNDRFDFVRYHKGMFSYLDLSKGQTDRLMNEFGIYTLDNGRVNVAGLNENNIDYFVDNLLKVC